MLANSIGGVNTWATGWWIFYVAPFVGAGLAAMTYKIIFAEDGEEKDDTDKEPRARAITADEESLAASIYQNAFVEDEEEGDKNKECQIPGVSI